MICRLLVAQNEEIRTCRNAGMVGREDVERPVAKPPPNSGLTGCITRRRRANIFRAFEVHIEAAQTAAAGAGQTVWLDHPFYEWRMLGQRPAIGSTRSGGAF